MPAKQAVWAVSCSLVSPTGTRSRAIVQCEDGDEDEPYLEVKVSSNARNRLTQGPAVIQQNAGR